MSLSNVMKALLHLICLGIMPGDPNFTNGSMTRLKVMFVTQRTFQELSALCWWAVKPQYTLDTLLHSFSNSHRDLIFTRVANILVLLQLEWKYPSSPAALCHSMKPRLPWTLTSDFLLPITGFLIINSKIESILNPLASKVSPDRWPWYLEPQD